MLQRPVEPAQYVSLAYSDALITAGVSASVGTVGDSYDCQSLRAGFREDEEVLAVVLCPISTIDPHGVLALICRARGRARTTTAAGPGVT